MKRLIALAVMLVALGAGVGPTFAAMDPPKVPPKGIEGPDIRVKVPPKGIEGPDIRQNTMPQPKGVEGPDVR
ncbi:MAG: hypothetical protein HYW08_09100 [candidate division NC10 bacterium]|nr:hypothetical protein [candidate division NC10 bacterium]